MKYWIALLIIISSCYSVLPADLCEKIQNHVVIYPREEDIGKSELLVIDMDSYVYDSAPQIYSNIIKKPCVAVKNIDTALEILEQLSEIKVILVGENKDDKKHDIHEGVVKIRKKINPSVKLIFHSYTGEIDKIYKLLYKSLFNSVTPFKILTKEHFKQYLSQYFDTPLS